MPVSRMYSSARLVTERAYWPKRRFSGSSMTITSPVMERVGISVKGSSWAVSGSGTKTMSLFSTEA